MQSNELTTIIASDSPDEAAPLLRDLYQRERERVIATIDDARKRIAERRHA